MDALADVAGIEIEDKRYSLSIHYRKASNKAAARASIGRAIESLPFFMRTVAGKLVINLVVADAPNKGDARPAHSYW